MFQKMHFNINIVILLLYNGYMKYGWIHYVFLIVKNWSYWL